MLSVFIQILNISSNLLFLSFLNILILRYLRLFGLDRIFVWIQILVIFFINFLWLDLITTRSKHRAIIDVVFGIRIQVVLITCLTLILLLLIRISFWEHAEYRLTDSASDVVATYWAWATHRVTSLRQLRFFLLNCLEYILLRYALL